MINQLHKNSVGIEFIVSDDDSIMRAHVTHVGVVKNGKLPLDMPQPLFLYNPLRRIKVVVNDFFGLALSSKNNSECD